MSRKIILTIIYCTLTVLSYAPQNLGQPATSADTFPLGLDHIFILVSKGAPESSALQKLGLYTDGKVYKHVGQGTSSITFWFENAYLELLWMDEPEVARKKGQEMGTDLVARANWRQTGASPFGVGLHRQTASRDALPFPTKEYRAEWMEPNTVILVAENSARLKEPFCFIVPDYLAFPSPEGLNLLLESKPEYRKNLAHPLGARKLTGVRIITDARKLSDTVAVLSRNGVVSMEPGKSHYVELTFDGGARGKSLDVRSTLPLVLKY